MDQPRADNGQFVRAGLADLEKFLLTVMNEREKSHNREHVLIDTALKTAAGLKEEAINQARDVVNDRLKHLNELRDEVIKDRALFVQKDQFDLVVKPLLAFREKALGFGALVSIMSAIFGSLVTALILGMFG